MNSQIVDVAVGIVFLFVTLSIFCTTITEVLARFNGKSKRAQFLEKHLRTLLNDQLHGGKDKVVNAILEHPLVSPDESRVPDTIRPRSFALALLEVSTGTVPSSFDELRTSVDKIDDAHVQKAVRSLVNTASDRAEAKLEGAIEEISDWFDHSMAQVGTWYKDHAQFVTRWVAIALVLVLNADVVMYAQALWTDEALRETIVTLAENRAQLAEGDATTVDLEGDLASAADAVRAQLAPLPLGWDLGSGGSLDLPGSAAGWFYKLLGLFITVVAISLGAPFWFDTLRKLSSIRRATSSG